MFYSIPSKSSKRNNVVSYTTNLARAFALTGLFRSITNDAPGDLVYLYLEQTDLSNLMGYSITYEHESNPLMLAPMKEMARNFMVYTFWEQADSLYRDMIVPYAYDSYGDPIKRTYPISTRKALRGLVIPTMATLEDLKDQIDALYSAVVSTPLDNRATATTNWYKATSRDQYGLLDTCECENLNMLRCVLYRYIEKNVHNGKLPDRTTIQTFCNLLDLVMILCGCSTYHECLAMKQVYDFSMKGTLLNCNNRRLEEIVNYDADRHYKSVNSLLEKHNSAVALLSKLTPQAALCVGAQFRAGHHCACQHVDSDYYWRIPSAILEKSTRPYLEVELYINNEVSMINRKLDDLGHKLGETTTNGCALCCTDDECEDEPCGRAG